MDQVGDEAGAGRRLIRCLAAALLVASTAVATTATIVAPADAASEPGCFTTGRDTDNDSIPDSLDVDDDNDGIPDIDEGFTLSPIDFSTAVSDEDGPYIGDDTDADGLLATVSGSASPGGVPVSASGTVSVVDLAVYAPFSSPPPIPAPIPDGNSSGDLRLGAYPNGTGPHDYSRDDAGQVMTLTFSRPVSIVLGDAVAINGLFDLADQWTIGTGGPALSVCDNGGPDFEYDSSNVNGTPPVVGIEGNGTAEVRFISEETDGDWNVFADDVTTLSLEMLTLTGSNNLSPINLQLAGSPDTDDDGRPDHLDLDSDNDGIHDVIEAGGADSDNDGRADGAVNPATGVPASAGAGLTPLQTTPGVNNHQNADSDGDACSDANEAYGSPSADGGDGGHYGADPAAVDANGAVTAASYGALDVAATLDDSDATACFPDAEDDSAAVGPTGASTYDVSANDNVPAGADFSLTGAGTAIGSASIDLDTGVITYTPDPSEAGSSVTVEYEVCPDGVASGGTGCDTATVTFAVDAYDAVDDSAAAGPTGPSTFDVSANDDVGADADYSLTGNGTATGSASINPNTGVVSYTPDPSEAAPQSPSNTRSAPTTSPPAAPAATPRP